MNIPQIADDALSPANVRRDRRAWARAFTYAAIGLFAVWAVFGLEQLWETRFSALAVYPGKWWGLIGVFTAPLIHADLGHIVANTPALVALTTLAFYSVPKASKRALPVIWILSGVGVWIFARPAAHLGASGITHGLMAFLFLLGILRRDRIAVAVSLAVFFLYGGMLMSTLPREQNISFEYHFFGAAAGAVSALAWWRLDPKPPKRVYSYQLDEAEDEAIDAALQQLEADPLEPPSPRHVPVLWDGPRSAQTKDDSRSVVVPFPRRPEQREEPLDPSPPDPDQRLH